MFTRICLWCSVEIQDIKEDPKFVPPSKPISKWTIKECRGRLKALRLPLEGKVSELRQKVQETINDPIPDPLGASNAVVYSFY